MKRALTGLLAALAIGCGPSSTPEGCGDGRVLIPETCDDLNNADGDGCSFNCVVEPGWRCAGVPSTCTMMAGPGTCGDGLLNEGEECDDAGESGACDTDCTFALCGDGILNARRGEQCDDANVTDGDGCSQFCRIEPFGCGDAICVPEETCTACPMDCAGEARCAVCPDMDGDGAPDSACGGPDCNDFDVMVGPGQTEVTCNRIDEDCDPSTPDALDLDGDGSSCNFDCDDGDPDRSPFYREICDNGIDDDCSDATSDLVDLDGDGAGCDVDCNDFDPTICPSCGEICNNGRDDDCDPSTPDPDADGDGDCAFDCDDADAARASYLREICGNAIDDDCDDATADAVVDADDDGASCDVDCDDADDAVSPDASGFCGPALMYFEDFEADDGGWTTGASGSSWEHGVPDNTFIDAAASGENAWVTNLDGSYMANELSYLESPAIDMSAALTDPTVRFALLYQSEASDRGWLEVSTDGGSAWRRVGRMGEGTGWYSDANRFWSGTSGSAGAWRTAQHVLQGTAGFADVRVRFVFDSDGSVQREGFGVDDVRITNRLLDLEVLSVIAPAELCADASAEVRVTVRNASAVAVPSFDVSYAIDGGAPVVETVSTPLAPGAEVEHVFAAVDLSAPGARVVTATATVSGDVDPTNDSRSASVTVLPYLVITATHLEDFEAGDGGFTPSGIRPTWAHGTPADTFISGAASGTNAWVTGLSTDYGNDEDSILASGCFDFSALNANPTLSFSHIFATEADADEGWVEVQVGTGTWQTLGAVGSGTNWYNDADDVWSGSSGSAGVWRTASHVLTGTRREPLVRIRFRFDSDGSTPDEGFGVDDFSIIP